jgi:predicted NUDIX family phosphoesterase
VHLGVIHLFEVERPAIRPREADLCDAGIAPLAELHADRTAFESWSQFVLDALTS